MKQIIIFGSGAGSNARNIYNFFNEVDDVEVAAIISNKKQAGIIEFAKSNQLDYHIVEKETAAGMKQLVAFVKAHSPNLIVLAGYLRKIPIELINNYSNQIINIHPALLPKYGGKGMYGLNVHRAVLQNKEDESGITIHYANEFYDEGEIIFQAKTSILFSDKIEDIERKVRALEIEHLPRIILQILNNQK